MSAEPPDLRAELRDALGTVQTLAGVIQDMHREAAGSRRQVNDQEKVIGRLKAKIARMEARTEPRYEGREDDGE